MRFFVGLSFVTTLSLPSTLLGGGTATWDNGGNDGEWTNNANWSGDSPPTDSGFDLFGRDANFGAAVPSGINLGANRGAEALTFTSGLPGNLEISGSGTLTVDSGITNNSLRAITLSTAFAIDADGALAINGNSGSIELAGNLFNSSTPGRPGGTVTFNGNGNSISGSASGVNIVVSSGATLVLDTGSTFGWVLDAGAADPGDGSFNQGSFNSFDVAGSLTGDSIFDISLAGNAFTDNFWNTDKSWLLSTGGDLSSIFDDFSGDAAGDGTVAGRGQFGFSGNTLTWTAVPEPSSLLVGGLLGLALFQRRRAGVSA